MNHPIARGGNAFNPRLLTLTLSGAALLLASFVGCTKSESGDARAEVKSAVADTKVAIVNAWDDVKTFTFGQRDKFTANATVLSARMDAQLAKVRTQYADNKADASRTAALDELKNADANYKEKVDALGQASADTWESAKKNTISAWDRLELAYDKARAN